jgi:hypothetical protein
MEEYADAVDIVETMFGESDAKELRIIPLAGSTVGRRISIFQNSL